MYTVIAAICDASNSTTLTFAHIQTCKYKHMCRQRYRYHMRDAYINTFLNVTTINDDNDDGSSGNGSGGGGGVREQYRSHSHNTHTPTAASELK